MTKVLLFGRLRDVAGWRETEVTPAPAMLSDLRRRIDQAWPELARALAGPGIQTAVNRALVRGDIALAPGAEVAFMPPMSGG
ncbi:MAG TPA: MoaD/ThiS family protein [Caulobacteraceae bacterium]